MPSSPTARNRLEKQAVGENVNTWGDKLNQTGLDLIDEAMDGVTSIAIASTAVVLTSSNYATDQARKRTLVLTGTLTANTTVTVPSVEKFYEVDDQTTRAGFTLTLKTSGGAGYALRPGPQQVYCDAIDVRRGTPRMDQLPLPTAPVDMNAQRLTNLPTPSANSDAATKKYVDDTAFSAAAGNLPGQAGNANRLLTTNGTAANWGPLTADLKDAFWGGTAGGTANALTATTGSSLTSLTAGQIVGVKTGASANSGAATLNVDGFGAKVIQRNGAALSGGELPASSNLWLQYDGTAWQIMGGGAGALSLPVTALSTAYPVVAADAGKLFDCTGTFTLTLPAASSVPNGFTVAAVNSGTGLIAAAASSGTVGGVASVTLNQSEWASFVSSGTAWKVLKGVAVSATGPVWSATDKDPSLVLSESATRLTATGTGQFGSARAVNAFSDKRYFEFDVIATTTPTTSPFLGFATATASIAAGARFSASATGWGYSRTGSKENGGTITAFGSSFGAADIVGWAVDPVAGKAWVRVNEVYQGSGDPVTGANPTFTFTPGLTLYPAAYLDGNSVATGIRLRKQANYAAPAGFTTL